jgi:hypothetical protein
MPMPSPSPLPARVGADWRGDPPTGGNNITCPHPRHELANVRSRASRALGELASARHVAPPPPPFRARWPRCWPAVPPRGAGEGAPGPQVPVRVRFARPPPSDPSAPAPASPSSTRPPTGRLASPNRLPRRPPPSGGSDAAPDPSRAGWRAPLPPTARESAARAGGPRRRRHIESRPHRRGAPCIGPTPPRPRAPCPPTPGTPPPQRPSPRPVDWPGSPLHILSDPTWAAGRGAIVQVREKCCQGHGLLWGCTVHESLSHTKWATFLRRPDPLARTWQNSLCPRATGQLVSAT